MGGIWRVLVMGCLMALMGVGAGCSLVREDGYGRLGVEVAINDEDWQGLKEAMVKARENKQAEAAWFEVMRAVSQIRNEGKKDGILKAAGEAGLPFERTCGPEALKIMGAEPENVPRVFWEGLPARARRMWLMQEIAGEASVAIAAGKPVGKEVRVQRLAGMMAQVKEGPEAQRTTVKAGMLEWAWTTRFVTIGEGRMLAVGRKMPFRLEEGDNGPEGVVLFGADGRVEAYGTYQRWPWDAAVGTGQAVQDAAAFDAVVVDGGEFYGAAVVLKPVGQREWSARRAEKHSEDGPSLLSNWPGTALPIYWQDPQTGKVGLKMILKGSGR